MPLPKISTPSYELIIPSTKKKVKFRPFLVKEEKILILAMESNNPTQVANAVKDVISSCILSRGVKVESLSTFDIEYIFLNIRGKSVGEEIEVMITCPDDEKTQVSSVINIDEIQIQESKDHSKDIKLDDNLTLRMKYPSMSEFIKSNFAVSADAVDVDDTFKLIASCIDQIYSEEESWAGSDSTDKELNEFVEQLSSKQFKEVENFFNTMPKLSHTVKVTNPNTKVESEVVLEGLQSFFE
tara:strand:+ start:440 stop:1162 length:723 start_codon:yes stop_codon:yes gene_type:complete